MGGVSRVIWAYVTGILITLFFVIVIFWVQQDNDLATDIDGRSLAQTYCATCHLTPAPEDLDRETWARHVLPRMAAMMAMPGYEHLQEDLFAKTQVSGSTIRSPFHTTPAMRIETWKAIEKYYISNAPVQLHHKKAIHEQSRHFNILFPSILLAPSTTYVSINDGIVIMTDVNSKTLYSFDKYLKSLKGLSINNPAEVDITQTRDGYLLTSMGSFSPTEEASGTIISQGATSPGTRIIIDQLQRPVHTMVADLNEDGKDEIIISEYGKWTGALSLWYLREDGSYHMQNLSSRSGAISSEKIDIDQDGDLDIIALFGQGDEGLKLYTNEGDLTFTENWLIRFPPSYGSSSFSLADVDEDGVMEILYTAGDNADYPPISKPYHGAYVYEIMSADSINQVAFWALPGAYGISPIDLDGVAPIDLVVHSFFPDYHNPVFNDVMCIMRSEKNTSIQQLNLSQHGRWLVMDTGDIDGDEDDDIILGSLAFEVPKDSAMVSKWMSNGLPFIVLENKLR